LGPDDRSLASVTQMDDGLLNEGVVAVQLNCFGRYGVHHSVYRRYTAGRHQIPMETANGS
jgi:hypothetical protein